MRFSEIFIFLKRAAPHHCDSAVLLALVPALLHDLDVPEAPRQRALQLHLPEVAPIVQALERDGGEEQLQVTAKVEEATFVVTAAGL